MKDHAINFLLYSYFGIVPEEWKSPKTDRIADEIAIKCAQRAYLDLSRTLDFKENSSKDGLSSPEKSRIEEEHQNFRIYMSKIVTKHIAFLFEAKSDTEFDELHKGACEEAEDSIIKEAIKYPAEDPVANKVINEGKFYYGQAQKWLNMTLKYMWLLGLWDIKFGNIEKYLHVPVDRYIIAVAKDRKLTLTGFQKKTAWSKWNKEEYTAFQESLRKYGFDGKTPLVWEAYTWIEQAKERKNEAN